MRGMVRGMGKAYGHEHEHTYIWQIRMGMEVI